MRLSVVGTGYVGLVTAACLADAGHDVTCVDVDSAKVDAVNSGRSFLHEPGLPDLLARHVPSRLRATTDLPAAVRENDLTMLAVPTPSRGDGSIDLAHVLAATEAVGRALREKPGFHALVVKSTCVPGTTDTIVRAALEKASGRVVGDGTLGLGCNPEFLSEGTAVDDFARPDRIVIGGEDERTLAMLRDLHESFAGVPVLATNCRTAEAIKYASNTLLAACISFANEWADRCEAIGGIDAIDVMRGVAMSRYLTVGDVVAPLASFLRPGCGYGGSCLPKDVAAATAAGDMPILDAVRETNDARAARLLTRMSEHIDLAGANVTVLGTAFKPGTADLRTSPAEPIVRALRDAGAAVTCHDPAAGPATRAAWCGVDVVDDLEDAVARADAIVVVTAWPEYEAVPAILSKLDINPLVVDGRRMLDPASVGRYLGIGLEEKQ